MEPLPHNATTTCRDTGCLAGLGVSVAGTSPSVTSTHDGIRMHSTAFTRHSTAVNHNAPGEPNRFAKPAANAPNTPPAARPKIVMRALVLDSVISGGSTRGVIADLSTVNDLDRTMLPSAAGYSSQLSKFSAITTASPTRSTQDAARASLRPRWILSSNGPITGAINANGATVISR